ncbi:MAG: hypothetical protein AAB588_01865 [Patescibacteria group bacterium]
MSPPERPSEASENQKDVVRLLTDIDVLAAMNPVEFEKALSLLERQFGRSNLKKSTSEKDKLLSDFKSEVSQVYHMLQRLDSSERSLSMAMGVLVENLYSEFSTKVLDANEHIAIHSMTLERVEIFYDQIPMEFSYLFPKESAVEVKYRGYTFYISKAFDADEIPYVAENIAKSLQNAAEQTAFQIPQGKFTSPDGFRFYSGDFCISRLGVLKVVQRPNNNDASRMKAVKSEYDRGFCIFKKDTPQCQAMFAEMRQLEEVLKIRYVDPEGRQASEETTFDYDVSGFPRTDHLAFYGDDGAAVETYRFRHVFWDELARVERDEHEDNGVRINTQYRHFEMGIKTWFRDDQREREVEHYPGGVVVERHFLKHETYRLEDGVPIKCKYDQEDKELLGLFSTYVEGKNGHWVSTLDKERIEQPDLTPQQYLQSLANNLDTPQKLSVFLRTCVMYTFDSPREDDPLTRGIEEYYGDYWQTPEQTVQRLGLGKMSGDCEDHAFLAQRILQLQGKHAIVINMDNKLNSYRSHAECFWVEAAAEGVYTAYSLATGGLRQYQASSAEEAFQGLCHDWDKSDFVVRRNDGSLEIIWIYGENKRMQVQADPEVIFNQDLYLRTMQRGNPFWGLVQRSRTDKEK